MKRKILWGLAVLIVLFIIGGIYAYSLYHTPHSDVQAAEADFEIGAGQLVEEYLQDAQQADQKYLPAGKEGQVLVVSGNVYAIDTDMKRQKVVLLKEEGDQAGVSCTFTESTNANAEKIKVGEQVAIKGVMRSGAGYDDMMELYEDVILEKCDLYEQKNKSSTQPGIP